MQSGPWCRVRKLSHSYPQVTAIIQGWLAGRLRKRQGDAVAELEVGRLSRLGDLHQCRQRAGSTRPRALRRGITVFVPTPRLRGGFKKLDPRKIPDDKINEAAGLSRGERWSITVTVHSTAEAALRANAPSRQAWPRIAQGI